MNLIITALQINLFSPRRSRQNGGVGGKSNYRAIAKTITKNNGKLFVVHTYKVTLFIEHNAINKRLIPVSLIIDCALGKGDK